MLTNKGRFVEGCYIDWHKAILSINARIQREFRHNAGLCNGLTGLRIALYSPRRCRKNGIGSGQILLFGIQNSNGNFAFGRSSQETGRSVAIQAGPAVPWRHILATSRGQRHAHPPQPGR